MVREHPPKPIACSYCDLGQAVSECSNRRCWSTQETVSNLRICQSCSPGGGISCACEGGWFCDTCKEPPMADCLKQCPQCKRAYCVSRCSEYIQFCPKCGRTTLCDDCAEEDWSSFTEVDGPQVQVKLVHACPIQTDSCWNLYCEECLEEQICSDCRQAYCTWCVHAGGWCRSCDRLVCWECTQSCHSCGKSPYCDECLLCGYCPQCSPLYVTRDSSTDQEYLSD
jgi:hypothetical protein